jgi:hypothetical protein
LAALYLESSLWTRYEGIAQNYKDELKDPQLSSLMKYVRYILLHKYTTLTKGKKQQIGFHLGKIEQECKKLRQLHIDVIQLKITLNRGILEDVKVQ